jgi:hypothetical protein
MSQSAFGVKPGEQAAQLFIAGGITVSDLVFLERRDHAIAGNMVDPLITVAGLMPVTRIFGESEIASSRTR